MSIVSISDASRRLSQLINQAAYGREIVILTSRGKSKAVLLGIESFQELVGLRKYVEGDLMLLDDFQRQFQEALTEAGYDTRDKIIDLVRDAKIEMANERK